MRKFINSITNKSNSPSMHMIYLIIAGVASVGLILFSKYIAKDKKMT